MPAHVTANKVLQHLFIKYVMAKHFSVFVCINKHTGIWREGANLWKIILHSVTTQVTVILMCLNILVMLYHRSWCSL